MRPYVILIVLFRLGIPYAVRFFETGNPIDLDYDGILYSVLEPLSIFNIFANYSFVLGGLVDF